jgi:hypothetical protein
VWKSLTEVFAKDWMFKRLTVTDLNVKFDHGKPTQVDGN